MLVRFKDVSEGGTKKQVARSVEQVLIDPKLVGAIRPRKTYTTLVVQGKYIHVAHNYKDVVRALGHTIDHLSPYQEEYPTS